MRTKELFSRCCAVGGIALVAFGITGSAGDNVAIALGQIKNADPDARIEGVRQLLTSLDSRIPETMLSLLTDQGDSIRRLAARAIGSRWWQIPKDKTADYTKALAQNQKPEMDFEMEKNMADRAIGLLTRQYDSKMFSKSPNGRWVIYERYGLPCLIDTTTETEELLGWPRAENGDMDMLVCAFGNEPISDDQAVWHPSKEAIALSVLLDRRSSTVWIWEHKVGLQKLLRSELARLLHPKGKVDESYVTDASIKGWKGDELQVSATGGLDENDGALLGWDLAKRKWRVISRGKQKQSD
ncbi:MAG TPA: hypothetical protein VKS98_00785 [Chthoniobacterales bacterium]|nr:hypothetical protein [Chthoniobacterales bacterium]